MRKSPGLLPLLLVVVATVAVFSHGLLVGFATVAGLYVVACFTAPTRTRR